jgi:hypothetical protein
VLLLDSSKPSRKKSACSFILLTTSEDRSSIRGVRNGALSGRRQLILRSRWGVFCFPEVVMIKRDEDESVRVLTAAALRKTGAAVFSMVLFHAACRSLANLMVCVFD